MWKTLISVSLLIGAGTMFHGAGLVLAIFGGFIWFAKPLGGMLSKLTQQDQPMFQNRRRLVAVSLAIGIACGLVAWAPSPWGVSSPAIVRYADLDRVRAAADGFVKAIDVTSGQQVAEGQVLLRLRNDALVVEWKKAQNALALAEAEARRVRSEQRHAEVQVENENVRALAKKEAGLRKRVAGLTLRAARNGIVLTPRLDRLIDRYVEKGDVLVEVGDPLDKELECAVPEQFVEIFQSRVGDAPAVFVFGQTHFARQTKFERIEPSATTQLRHEAWGGQQGGPLPVRPASDGTQGYRLVHPHFHGVVKVDADYAARLQAGQLGEVRFWDASESIGRRTWRNVEEWFREKWAAAQASALAGTG